MTEIYIGDVVEALVTSKGLSGATLKKGEWYRVIGFNSFGHIQTDKLQKKKNSGWSLKQVKLVVPPNKRD